MSDATAVDTQIPDGWYDDPATPNMQRWWSGTDWSEHVRYSDKVRPFAAVPKAPAQLAIVDSAPSSVSYPWAATPVPANQVSEPLPVTEVAVAAPYAAQAPIEAPFIDPQFQTPWSYSVPSISAQAMPAERPQLALVASPAFVAPAAWSAPAEPDNFYIPMAMGNFQPGASSLKKMMPRRSVPRGVIWVSVLAIVGVAVGTALWILLPN